MSIEPRKGQATDQLTREVFRRRFRDSFYDPAFRAEDAAIDRLETIAWDAYANNRKSPLTEKAGAGFADPDYDLSSEWRAASQAVATAQRQHDDPASPPRVLVVIGSSRNDGSCPGEVSKTWRLAKIIGAQLAQGGMEVDLLDLSRLTSEYGRRIYPCKGCVSTAMPLCHWPCSCYPNYALQQSGDWMHEIYPRWVAAHGVILLTPVYWYQPSSSLKLMIDRLVCADGGNPDPTATGGKNAAKAKQLELQGWSYPKHLAGRLYGVVVHGDVAGTEATRRSLSDWLDWMGLIDAGSAARLDRYIGYYQPYASSHEALDVDVPLQQEVCNVATAMCRAVDNLRAGRPLEAGLDLQNPRPK